MRKSILIFSLILIVGLIPISIHFLGNNSLEGNTSSLPIKNLTIAEQQAQTVAGLIVKPVYMLASLIIILALTGQKQLHLKVLRWGQISFLTGEFFCALNFYIYNHESILSEYLHSYGMVLAFGFTTFAILEGWDSRFGRRIQSRLAGGASALIKFIIPTIAILTFIPLLSPLQTDAYSVTVFSFPYSYTRFDFYQLFERRMLPWIALIAFTAAYLPFLKKGHQPIPEITKIFLSAGLAALGFSIFRVGLNAIFIENLVWFEFWEEVTELLFISTIGFVLWHFNQTLLKRTRMLDNLSNYFGSSK